MKITERIHNIETNEIQDIEREMSEIELAEKLKADEQRAELAQLQAETQAKRTAALAKLEALGLTADDLKALGL